MKKIFFFLTCLLTIMAQAQEMKLWYLCVKNLQDSLQVPVGVITNAIGGTDIESWFAQGNWYEKMVANRTRAFRYATPYPSRVPAARIPLTCTLPAISPYLRHGCMAGYPYQMPTA